MLLSHKKIAALEEKKLREEVLLPLFTAMGYRDVYLMHGPSELGKDIVMWRPDPARGRINTAVVVKAKSIGSRELTEVRNQVEQALSSEYPDPRDGSTQKADDVLVVTSGDIKPNTLAALSAQFKSIKVADRVEFVQGVPLAKLVSDYLVQTVIWDALEQSLDVLSKSFPSFRPAATVGPDGGIAL